MHRFLHRYVEGAAAPLKPGRYDVTIDAYDVDRAPRIGENCTAYIAHVLQHSELVSTVSGKITITE